MFEFKITLFGGNETIAGIAMDRGERRQLDNEEWSEYFRVRIGLILLTLDFSYTYI